MIEVIYISVGNIHKKVPESVWDNMASEMSQKFKCDVIFDFSNNEDTTMRVDGDLTFDEMFDPQEIFSRYIDPLN